MQQTSFTWNEATVTVKQPTIADQLNAEWIADTVRGDTPYEPNMGYLRRLFGEFLTTVQHVEGDLGFPLPTISAPAEELRDAFNAWQAADPSLLYEWRIANRALEQKKRETARSSTAGSKTKPKQT